jgi:DNA-binding MarR family transcriptional regulator
MLASGTAARYEILALEVFDTITQFCLAAPRVRRRPGALKEIEYLALSLLRRHEPRIVGDLQRQLGILPAQMSRIIRSLEARDRPLIACRINSADKRKIDVALTEAGARACGDYQGERVAGIAEILRRLSPEDLDLLAQLLERLREVNDQAHSSIDELHHHDHGSELVPR